MVRRAVVLALAVASTVLSWAGEDEGGLRAVIARANERCARIYGGAAGREHGYATGLIISPDGLILTAQGIYLTEGRLRVVLPDGTHHDAEVVRRSEELQAALLKVDAKTPHYFDLSDAARAQPGDWVVAVSNVFNVAAADEPLSATLGVVSLRAEMEARHRTQDVPYEGDLLLIDAITSNPGAPGGALCALDGRLVGMLGKLFESASTRTRINYAVPIDLLRPFAEGREAPAVAEPAAAPKGEAQVGIRLFTLSGRHAPAYIDRVAPDSPARQAGLQKDDLVLAMGGVAVRDCAEYEELAKALVPGRPVVFLVKRKMTIRSFKVTPAAAPQSEEGK